MKSIAQNNHQDKVLANSIYRFFKEYHLSALLKSVNAYKSKGIPAFAVFTVLFGAIFTQRSLYMGMLVNPSAYNLGKDTLYRFLNAAQINWLRFTSLLSARIASKTIEPLTDEQRVNVLIVDDSMFSRGRSKKVELLAKVFDHAKGVYDLGFRLLTVCWSDGNTVLPVNSCLLSTANAKNRLNITWQEGLQKLMQILEEVLTKNLDLSEKEMQTILDVFLANLPRTFSMSLCQIA